MTQQQNDNRQPPSDEVQGKATESSEASPAPKRRSRRRLVIGVALGAAAGFAYYFFIGCNTGGCPITSSPWISTLYGSALGGVIANI